jgi:hypothetical protein
MTVISGNSPEGCTQALLQYCRELAIRQNAMQEVLQVNESELRDQYNSELLKSQRSIGPVFHDLADLADRGNWTRLQERLRETIDGLQG